MGPPITQLKIRIPPGRPPPSPYTRARGCLAPEELEQSSTNGGCGKQQAEPEGGAVLDASLEPG
jgi:hypothetical protein